jgi:hypothetical protein
MVRGDANCGRQNRAVCLCEVTRTTAAWRKLASLGLYDVHSRMQHVPCLQSAGVWCTEGMMNLAKTGEITQIRGSEGPSTRAGVLQLALLELYDMFSRLH